MPVTHKLKFGKRVQNVLMVPGILVGYVKVAFPVSFQLIIIDGFESLVPVHLDILGLFLSVVDGSVCRLDVQKPCPLPSLSSRGMGHDGSFVQIEDEVR